MESWIRRTARTRVRNQLIAWTLLTLLGLAVNLFFVRYWTNFFNGPFPTTTAQLAAIGNAQATPRTFVTVDARKVIDTGVQEIVKETSNGRETSRHVAAGYYALVGGPSVLIAKSSNEPDLKVTGELKPMTDDLLKAIDPDGTHRARLYPFYLDTESFRKRGYIALACGVAWLFIAGCASVIALRRYRDIALHPAVARAEAWPYAEQGIALAEQERNSPSRLRQRAFLVTDHFVIREGILIFDIYPLEHLLWAYRKTTTTRYMGFIPVGKRSEAMLHFKGGSLQVPGRKKKILELLSYVSQRAPWAVTGYSAELFRQYSQSLPQFTANVDQRRAAIRAQQPGRPVPPRQPPAPSSGYDFTQPLAPPSR